MKKESTIYVTGSSGLVGTAVCRKLKEKGYTRVITLSHSDLDLTRQSDVEEFFAAEKPEYVFHAAGKVGGIYANATYPAEFIFQNLSMALNVIHSSYRNGVKKLINLGSSCIYPKLAPQPMREEYLLSGPLEPTNEAYAVAKIAAIKLCIFYNRQYGTEFLSTMPTNLYGPGDNYDLSGSHVLPAMIRKIHEARVSGSRVVLWGDGSPFREFLYSEDLADALIFLMENCRAVDIGDVINIGSGKEISIRDLSGLIAGVLGYKNGFDWDTSKPNGTPRKLLDISRLKNLGWVPKMDLKTGIGHAYKDFLARFGTRHA
ncbi:MAG: GDP-L-fucose synthase [Spirochaetales bacterium]|nr:GDP-L-fucose synthase [Spirochaetales bacterium]